MKFLKWTGIILGALLLLLVVAGIVMPKEFEVVKSQVIETPPSVPYHIVNDLSLQESWNPWVQDDEDMELSFSENTIGEGAMYTWQSPSMGNGSQLITETVEGQKIGVELAFEEEDKAQASYAFAPHEDGTVVTWTMKGSQGFPKNIMIPLMKYGIGKSFSKGLKNLATQSEMRWNDNQYYGYEIKPQDLPQRSFVMRRTMVPYTDIQQFYITNLGGLFQAVSKSGIEMDGMPCGLYFGSDSKGTSADMAAAIPVSEPVEIQDAASLTMDAGPGLIIEHYGDYGNLEVAYTAAEIYMKDRNLVHHAPYIEEYITDPTTVDDPSKVLTKVFYYIADSGIEK